MEVIYRAHQQLHFREESFRIFRILTPVLVLASLTNSVATGPERDLHEGKTSRSIFSGSRKKGKALMSILFLWDKGAWVFAKKIAQSVSS